MVWGAEKRLAFIETRLYWEGQINRKDLTAFFGISVPQASADLKRYGKLAPQNLHYDASAKVYLASPDFNPVFISTHPVDYFKQLLAGSEESDGTEENFLGFRPDFYRLPFPGRSINAETLRIILNIIKEKQAIHIHYQSMRKPKPQWRWITPHAFGFDGFRWHLRAYCHNDEQFKDFTLGRIFETAKRKSHLLDSAKDILWHNDVTFKIAAHPKLSPGQKKAVEYDYGMENGVLDFKVRAAFIYYVIRQLRLQDSSYVENISENQIVLLNRKEIETTQKILKSIKVK